MLDRILARWPLKLLAVVIAYVIWLAVVGQNKAFRDFDVPLIVGLDDDRIVSGEVPRRINLRVSGPESIVQNMEPLRLSFDLDLRGTDPGERSFGLTSNTLRGLPRGVEIVRIDPSRLAIAIERKVRKVVPVLAVFEGAPPVGYTYYGARIVPLALEIEGPESRVTGLTALETEPISLEEQTQPFVTRVAAIPESAEVRVLDSRRLEVQVDVDEAPDTRRFRAVAVTFAGQLYETDVRPNAVDVTVTGPPRLLAALDPEQIRATADLTGLDPGPSRHNVALRIELSDVATGERSRLQVTAARSEVSVRVSEKRIQP